MLEFTNTICIDRPITEVFAFLSNFENIPKWNYYVLKVTKRSDGPSGIGTIYHQVRQTDEQNFRIIEFDPNHRIVIKTLPYSIPSFERKFSFYEGGAGLPRLRCVAIDQPYTAAAVVFPDGRQAEGLPTKQTKPLASQSFLPVDRAPTLNGRTFQEGIVPYLAQDVSFVLDRLAVLNQADPNGILTGQLDLQRAGTFGWSLGGLVGGEACQLETRLRACMMLDAP